MSPVYDPPPEKISRLTLANLAFLGVNALVAVALVYGLWRGGRLIVSPSREADRASGAAATPDGDGDGGSAAGDQNSAGPPGSGSKTAPGTAVYYSNPAEYDAANPHPAALPDSASSSGARDASPRPAPRGTSQGSASAPGTATYSVANPPGSPGSTRAGSSPSGAAASSGSGTVGGAASTAAGSGASGPGARPGTNPINPRTGDTFTTTGRSTPGGSTPPTHTPTPPPSTPPGQNPDTHHNDTPPADDPPVETEPGSDRTPPVLDSLVFDPPQVVDGASSVLYIRTHDDLSGVARVTGTIKSPTGGALFSFSANDDGSGTTFAARVSVPAKAEAGGWYVANLYVADRVDNTLVLGYTPGSVPDGGRLNVTSTQSDTTAPRLLSVDLENGSVRGGETERVRLSVEDDVSGVAGIVGTFQSPARSAGMTFAAHPEDEARMWIADFRIPTNADCGDWRMTSLRMTDNAGNTLALGADSPQLARVSFGVMTDGCDSSAPYLESLTISPSVVSNEAASQVTITAVARDDDSGVAQASGWVGGPPSAGGEVPKLSFSCGKANPNVPDSAWTCRVPVPQFAARGTWHMGRMRLQDRAGNVHDYMPDDSLMAGATFDVQ